MRHLLSIVFGAAFTAATSWSIGRLLFTRLRIRLHRVEHDLLAAITGAALLSCLIFLLCATHLAIVPVFWAIGLIALALNWKFAAAPSDPLPNPVPRQWMRICAVPLIIYTLLYLANSLAPEHSPDGQTYHLGNVSRFFRQHGFERVTTNMYANLSQGFEMLYLFAFSFGRHAAAATLHCFCLFALPLLILSYARRIGKPVAGACAAMLVFLSPLAGIDGVSAYNDVALATAGFATFYLLEIWRDTRQQSLLIPIGLTAGFCFAMKYTGYTAATYVIAILIWELILRKRAPRRQAFAALATVTALVVVMAGPWLLKNWIWLGNPIFPFLNRVFPNPFTHITFEDEYRRYLSTYDLPSFKPLFWIVTVTGQLGGQLGPVFLLAPLALLTLRSREGRALLLACAFFMLPWSQNLGARFLLPALPFAALGIAIALEFSWRTQAALVILATFFAWPNILFRYHAPTGGWQIASFPWKAALGITPQDTYLAQHAGEWVTARMLDQYVPEGKRVWSTDPIAESYEKTDVLVNYYSAEGELIQDILYSPTKPEFPPTSKLRYTFAPRAVNHLRLLQRASPAPDVWSIAELRFFLGAQEIHPEKHWKPEASSFPWDIALALDRNPATRWRAWEPLHPGMSVSVNFGQAITLDRIELNCSHDQPNIDIALDGIRASLEKLDEPEPVDLRRIATATVKARGIDYLMIGGDTWLTKEMHDDPARWGLRKIADRGHDWLFEIQ